jgi:hypothetical protein
MYSKSLVTKISAMAFLASSLFVSSAQAATTDSAQAPARILSKCTIPPCGEIYNHTNMGFSIRRKDSDSGPWIYSTVGPGGHKGGYFNDGIDWDQYGIPYRCTVNLRDGNRQFLQSNTTVQGNKYVAFSSSATIHIDSYSCSGT